MMKPAHYWQGFVGIQTREWLKFWQQRTRLASALVRPLLWLVIFSAGFKGTMDNLDPLPQVAAIDYETYITPGLCAMIILFNSMQGALSMVYDRELGSMRVLLTSPLPRPFLLVTKLLAMGGVSIAQVYLFLALARLVGVESIGWGYLAVLPALTLTSLMLGALGLLIATWVKQLENFAGVMNFVIFPMFFLSSALYPLSRMNDANPWLYWLCQFNPFTHAVESIRFCLHLAWNPQAFGITAGVTLVLALLATASFRPQRTRILGARKIGA